MAGLSIPLIPGSSKDDYDPYDDPITYVRMTDPVSTPCGHTFQRETVVKAVQLHSKCPLCNAQVSLGSLVTNYGFKQAIEKNAQMAATSVRNANPRPSFFVPYDHLKENSPLPNIEEHPLIDRKRKNRDEPLTIHESITLTTDCIRYGQDAADAVRGRPLTIVVGPTDSGKSTFVNRIVGCNMVARTSNEVGASGGKKLRVEVSPASPKRPVTEISHQGNSRTLIPVVAFDPETGICFCDPAGWRDNRGEEIGIANAVNLKNMIEAASEVRVIILVEHASLAGSKSEILNDSFDVIRELFGDDILQNYSSCFRIGITKMMNNEEMLADLGTYFNDLSTKLRIDLRQLLFISDPTERHPQAITREALINEIQRMPSIPTRPGMCNVVLTPKERLKLNDIKEVISASVIKEIYENRFENVQAILRLLSRLSVIQHDSIDKIVETIRDQVSLAAKRLIHEFNLSCRMYQSELATQKLGELKQICALFNDPKLNDEIQLDALEAKLSELDQKRRDLNLDALEARLSELNQGEGELSIEDLHLQAPSTPDALPIDPAVIKEELERFRELANNDCEMAIEQIERHRDILEKNMEDLSRDIQAERDRIIKDLPEEEQAAARRQSSAFNEIRVESRQVANTVLNNAAQRYRNIKEWVAVAASTAGAGLVLGGVGVGTGAFIVYGLGVGAAAGAIGGPAMMAVTGGIGAGIGAIIAFSVGLYIKRRADRRRRQAQQL